MHRMVFPWCRLRMEPWQRYMKCFTGEQNSVKAANGTLTDDDRSYIGRFSQQAAGIRDIPGTYRITKFTLVTMRAKASETAFFAEKAGSTRKSVLTVIIGTAGRTYIFSNSMGTDFPGNSGRTFTQFISNCLEGTTFFQKFFNSYSFVRK